MITLDSGLVIIRHVNQLRMTVVHKKQKIVTFGPRKIFETPTAATVQPEPATPHLQTIPEDGTGLEPEHGLQAVQPPQPAQDNHQPLAHPETSTEAAVQPVQHHQITDASTNNAASTASLE